MGTKRNAYRVLMRKPRGKRPLGRPIRKWESNIKMDIRQTKWYDVEWIGLARYRNQ
jgi:hypothetical protein